MAKGKLDILRVSKVSDEILNFLDGTEYTIAEKIAGCDSSAGLLRSIINMEALGVVVINALRQPNKKGE